MHGSFLCKASTLLQSRNVYATLESPKTVRTRNLHWMERYWMKIPSGDSCLRPCPRREQVPSQFHRDLMQRVNHSTTTFRCPSWDPPSLTLWTMRPYLGPPLDCLRCLPTSKSYRPKETAESSRRKWLWEYIDLSYTLFCKFDLQNLPPYFTLRDYLHSLRRSLFFDVSLKWV